MDKRCAVGALVVNALIWGVSWWPFRELAERGLHSLWATGLVHAAAFGVVAAMRPAACREMVRLPSIWAIGAAAGATNACFNWAVSTGDVVRVVLLFYLMPIWAMLLARMLLAEPLRGAAWLRAAVALLGAALVLSPGGAAWPVPRSRADWLAVAGGMCFALTNVLLRREARRPQAVRALGMFAGGVAVPGVAAAALSWAGTIGWPPAPQAGWMAGTLALAAAFLVANLALQYGAARLPTALTSVVMLTEVVFASASAVALGAAHSSPATLAGGALIVATALWAAVERPRGVPAAA